MSLKTRIALLLAALMAVFVVYGTPATATPSYSTDPGSPTLVAEVPEGFTPYGEPTVVTENCVTTTTQVYSHLIPGQEEISHIEHHPAIPAVTETVPGVWANWSPNHTQGPQNYVPIWPQDDRGTWHVHSQGVPPGHAGPDGVYQQGGGNSPWFYRQAEKVIVITPEVPAWDEKVIDQEATEDVVEYVYTVTVTGEACPEEPPVPPTTEEPPAPPVGVPGPPTVNEPNPPALIPPVSEEAPPVKHNTPAPSDVPVSIDSGL